MDETLWDDSDKDVRYLCTENYKKIAEEKQNEQEKIKSFHEPGTEYAIGETSTEGNVPVPEPLFFRGTTQIALRG